MWGIEEGELVVVATRNSMLGGSEVVIFGNHLLGKALKQLLEVLGFTVTLNPSNKESLPGSEYTCVAFVNSAEELLEEFKPHWVWASKTVIVANSNIEDSLKSYLYAKIPQEALVGWTFCSPKLHDILSIFHATPSVPMWLKAETYVERVIHAVRLFPLLRKFIHRQNTDIVNSYLAPARMLISSNSWSIESIGEDWIAYSHRAMQEFNNQVVADVQKLPSNYGRLGVEVTRAACSAAAMIDALASKEPEKLDIGAIENLMELLTECRELADQDDARDVSLIEPKVVEPIGDFEGNGEHPSYKVLVIDDHANQWTPVLRIVARECEMKNVPLRFEFCTFPKKKAQAKSLKEGALIEDWITIGAGSEMEGADLFQALPEYDVVLLDVFLGELSGLDLLESIRKINSTVPVIIWTTSRQIDIPAAASLSNGFLFKKRCTCQDVAEALLYWAPEGRSRRTAVLLTRFFDDNISSNGLRQICSSFTKWFLRLVDSFHAVDEHLKYYTDHGGRHIQGLMSIIADLVTPIWKCDDIFTKNAADSEGQLVALYLAVLAHEIGMFPGQRADGVLDRPEEVHVSVLKARRKHHAIRGMVILESDSFIPNDLQSLMDQLDIADQSGLVRSLLCLLTGYHARFLDLSAKGFEKNLARPEKRGEEPITLDKAVSRDGLSGLESHPLIEEMGEFEPSSLINIVLAKLKDDLVNVRDDGNGILERARKMCAVFRFADAIDIDRSRLPADFLRRSPDRTHINDREHLKRQIVEEVSIEKSTVSIHVNAVKPQHFPGELAAIEHVLDDPWSQHGINTLVQFLEDLDTWLEHYWASVKMKRSSWRPDKEEDYQDAILVEEYMNSKFGGIETHSARSFVAGLTAICVAAEIADEYEAIEQVGLTEHIRLDRVSWCTEDEWEPSLLTVIFS